MLPKERVIAALEFHNPDRIPTGEIGIDFALAEQSLGHPTLYRAKWREYAAIWQGRRDEYVESCKRDIVALARKFDHDIVPAFLVPSRYKMPAQPQFISQFKWRMPDGRVYVYSPETQGNAFIVDGPRPESVEEVPDRAVDVDESQFELIQYLVAELGDTHFIVARPPDDGIFPHDAYEMQWLLSSMAERPEVVERVIAVESSHYIEIGKRMLDAGCDAVITHNDVAGRNGLFMSPVMFERFCWPWLKAWADMAHARGKYFFKHTDGNTWKILDLMIAAGVDAWHGIQPSIGMALPELQAQYGGRLCFWGGVDLDTLIAGTEDQVENEVRLAIESSPTEGGLILGAGNAVMVGVGLTNYLEMMRAVRVYQTGRSHAARHAAEASVVRDSAA